MKQSQKIVKIFSVVVIISAIACVYAAAIRHVYTGGERLGFLTEPIKQIASFPALVKNVLTSNEIKNIPPTYALKDTSIKEKNNININIYALNTFYDCEENLWTAKLFNLQTDSVLYQWKLKKEYFDYTEKIEINRYDYAIPRNPIFNKDTSLIFSFEATNGMFKIDKNSELLWHNTDYIFHHALNIAEDGNVWCCTRKKEHSLFKNRESFYEFKEPFITKIDETTGKTLYHKSVVDLLTENNYKGIVYGVGNNCDRGMDMIHLNDVQPVLTDGKYWQQGDVFLSLRNRSIIILYRPKTNKILTVLSGPFIKQHDVDIISGHEIAIFNNNSPLIGRKTQCDNPAKTLQNFNTCDIVIYDFESDAYRTYLKHHFLSEDISTVREGMQEFIGDDLVYIEDQNNGVIYIVNEENVLLRKQFDTPKKGYIQRPHWIRIYNDLD